MPRPVEIQACTDPKLILDPRSPEDLGCTPQCSSDYINSLTDAQIDAFTPDERSRLWMILISGCADGKPLPQVHGSASTTTFDRFVEYGTEYVILERPTDSHEIMPHPQVTPLMNDLQGGSMFVSDTVDNWESYESHVLYCGDCHGLPPWYLEDAPGVTEDGKVINNFTEAFDQAEVDARRTSTDPDADTRTGCRDCHGVHPYIPTEDNLRGISAKKRIQNLYHPYSGNDTQLTTKKVQETCAVCHETTETPDSPALEAMAEDRCINCHEQNGDE